MRAKGRKLVLSSLVLAVVGLGGCQPAPLADVRPEGSAIRGRSLVFDSPRLERLTRGQDPEELHWYDVRNDAQLATQAGFRSAVVDSAASLTYDRQHQSGGGHSNRVHDHYSRTTYRQQAVTTVR